jgi:hypothetical protein
MTSEKYYLFFILVLIAGCTKKGKFDIVDKPNSKIGILFERAVAKEKASIEHGFYSGLMPGCTKRIDQYLRTVKSIESYASKGTESKDKFNRLEVKITFNDGNEANKLYTGIRVVQAYGMGAQLLLKIELVNGKVVKAYTNGAELANAPEAAAPDIEYIKKAVLNYDMQINKSAYYYPAKTQKEIKEEWNNIK